MTLGGRGPGVYRSLRYCVVGGGISGLVAAYRIRAALGERADITVFDPADRLGGVLRTERMGGQAVDIGAEAFIARRPEVPALLAELGLAGRQIGTTGVRPMVYSQARLHPLPADTVSGIPSSAASVAGLVDAATCAKIAAEPDRPLRWQSGSDPALGDVVADRFGEQVVTRSVDPLLSGVYAGSAVGIGIRSAAPTVAAALDTGAASVTEAVLRVLPGAVGGPMFGALDGGYQVLLDELVACAAPRWVAASVARLAFRSGLLKWSFIGFILLLLLVYTLAQQVDNLWLRPQFLGKHLRLHPGVVFVGLIGALALSGVLGAFVIVPIIATMKMVGSYVHRKLLGLPPWPEEEPPADEDTIENTDRQVIVPHIPGHKPSDPPADLLIKNRQ